MAFYTPNKVKTEIIDPHYYSSNDRVEFRLDRGTLMNNVKLVNLGCLVAGNPFYNPDAGVLCLIKNIHLYDGKVVLQSQEHSNERSAFQNAMNSNSYNGNVDRYMKLHSQGYTIGGDLTDGKGVEELAPTVNSNIPAVDALGNVKKGGVWIGELLPIIKVLPCLPSSVFKQLRLVIEFESDIRNVLSDNSNPLTTIKPALIVDRIIDQQAEAKEIAKLGNATFMNYEYTQLQMPAVASGVQEVNKKVLAFNNKTLHRLKLKLNYQDKSKYIDTNLIRNRGLLGTSFNVSQRAVQYRVNGANLLPRSNIKGDMRRLALLTDTYGNINMTPEMPTSVANGSGQNGVCILEEDDENIGVKDFDGVYIGQVIEDLQLQISRNFLTDAVVPSRYNDALNIVIEGEVEKTIQFGNGGYNVGYVA